MVIFERKSQIEEWIPILCYMYYFVKNISYAIKRVNFFNLKIFSDIQMFLSKLIYYPFIVWIILSSFFRTYIYIYI